MTRVVLLVAEMNGLNEAVCTRLAQFGYRVTAIHHDTPQRFPEMRLPACLHVERCELNDREAIRRCIQNIEEAIGPIDILIGPGDIAYELIQMLGESMAERGWGRIIEISARVQDASLLQDQGRLQCKTLVPQWQAQGVTLNTISLGSISAPTEPQSPQQAGSGHLSQAAEVAGLIAYLVTDEAGFLSGANIPVNGGRQMI
jgi:acetoacetyl-CoA reductase